jgi:hypothetical protein
VPKIPEVKDKNHSNFDELAKSRFFRFSVIPAEAGIQ